MTPAKKDIITRLLTLDRVAYFRLATIFSIVILGFIVYFNSLSNPFIWDDLKIVKDNSFIRTWSNLPQLLTTNLAADSTFYRPVQVLSYMIDYQFWAGNVVGYHLTNLLLHIAVACCIFWLMTVLFKDNRLAALTSLLFVVHPVHTEAVSYISGRADLLVTLFILLSCIFYIRFLETCRRPFLILTYVSFTLGLLSKEYALIFFGILLIYHLIFKKKVDWKLMLPLALITVVYFFLRHVAVSPYLVEGATHLSLGQRWPGAFVAITRYLQLLIIPVYLHMGYGQVTFAMGHPRVMLGAVLCVVAIVLVFSYRKKSPLVSFLILWFIVGLIPVLNIFPINAYMAEHWLYLPSIGFLALVAKVLTVIFRRKYLKIFASVPAIYLIIFYSFLTIRQNIYWSSPVKLYKRVILFNPNYFDAYINLAAHLMRLEEYESADRYHRMALSLNPNSQKAHNNYAASLDNQGKQDEAIKHYMEVLRINPNYEQSHSNLGLLYARQDKFDMAEYHYRQALKIKPSFDKAHYNLALLLYKIEKRDEAVEHFEETIRLNPLHKEAHNNLGVHYINQGQVKEAIDHYQRALEINPNYDEAHYNLGVLFEQQGDVPKAMMHLKQALEINFDHEEAHNSMGLIYAKQGKLDKAVLHYKDGLKINPKNINILNNLAIALSNQGNNINALQYFTIALEVEPDNVVTHNNYGLVLSKEKNYDLAIKHFKRALAINPNYVQAYINLGLTLTSMEKLDEAEENYNQALSLDENNVVALNGLGIISGKRGNYEEAAKIFLKALKIDPENANAINNIKRIEKLLSIRE